MNTTDCIDWDNTFGAKTYAKAPDFAFERGQGAYLFDTQGKAYLDFGSGIGVMSLGYSHPKWLQAVQDQLVKLTHTSNLFHNTATAQAEKVLCERTGFERVFLSNSGAEANECLIKCARKWAHDHKGPGDHPVVTLYKSFHGRTMSTLTATGQDAMHKYFDPFMPGYRYVPANDLNSLEATLANESCAAVLLEVVQGEGGVRALDADYLVGVQALCQKYNTLLCIDEVQTGNGRTGTWFAFEQFGLTPDIVSTAKGVGGGLPIGATFFGQKTADVFTPGTHGSTYGGNLVAAAAAKAMVELVDDALLARVNALSQTLFAALKQNEKIEDVSGLGLMIGFSVKGATAQDVKAECLKRGLIVLTAKDRIRLLPPFILSDEELQKGLTILFEVIDELTQS